MLKSASKNIVPSPSYDLLKIAICLLLQYANHIAQNHDAQKQLLERTTHAKVLKLGLYVTKVT